MRKFFRQTYTVSGSDIAIISASSLFVGLLLTAVF